MLYADAVFLNGIVVTVDSRDTITQAIAVKNGRIIDVGANEIICTYKGPDTQICDLAGKMILPAAYDSHVHSTTMGANSLMIDFSYPAVDTIEKVRQKIIEATKILPDGAWIRGYGLDDENIKEYRDDVTRKINHRDYDDICANHPFKITLWSGHGAFLNQKAMDICGIDDLTPDPISGSILHDTDGCVTGLVMEGGGLNLVEPFIPQFSDKDVEQSILSFEKMLHAEGYTGYTNATLGPADNRNSGISGIRAFDAYRRLYDARKLTCRVALGFYAGRDGVQTAENVKESIDAFPFEKYNPNPAYLKTDLIKIFCDGVHLNYTGWLKEDYVDRPGYHGRSCFLGSNATDEEQKDEFQKIVNIVHRKGFQIAIHAIGDRAVSYSIDVLSCAIQEFPRADARHYILHTDSLGNNEMAAKAARFGILYSVQPGLMDYIIEPSISKVGKEKAERMMGLKEYLQTGVICCGGSDGISGVYQNWRESIQSAVTRRSKISQKVYHKELALTILEGIRLFTINAAIQEHCEQERGSIEIGKVADFQVLDQDIFRVDPEKIGSIQVLETYMDGKLIYKR